MKRLITIDILVDALANADWLRRVERSENKVTEIEIGDCYDDPVFDDRDLQSLCDELNKRIK